MNPSIPLFLEKWTANVLVLKSDSKGLNLSLFLEKRTANVLVLKSDSKGSNLRVSRSLHTHTNDKPTFHHADGMQEHMAVKLQGCGYKYPLVSQSRLCIKAIGHGRKVPMSIIYIYI